MNSNDPIFPYQNLFITARPGMGASTLVAEIVSKYLSNGKKCLVFQATDHFLLTYVERIRIIREDLDTDTVHPWFEDDGKLRVIYDYFFEPEPLLTLIDEYGADVVVYEASRYLRDQGRDLIKLAEVLKSRGKTFIFVTRTKKRWLSFAFTEIPAPSASRHRAAIPYFDATAIIYSPYYPRKHSGRGEEIRIYEKGKKKYRTFPVELDFQKQRITRK